MKKAILIVFLAIFSFTLFASDYAAKLTRAGEVLSQDFWVSTEELQQALDATIANARSQGVELDPYFDNMYLPSKVALKFMLVSYIVDEKIVDIYALENSLLPDESEVESETDAMLSQYTSSPEIVTQIEAIYGSIDNFRKEIRNYVYQSLKAGVVQDNIAPLNDEALTAYFEQNKENLKNSYEYIRARHILLSDEATATSLKNKINAGEITFAEAALQFSIDSGTATNGGQLGAIQRGQTVAEFEEAILTAPIGELYGPVKSQFGYHLIIVEERKSIESLNDIVSDPQNYNDFVSAYQNDTYYAWIEKYIADNAFGYEILDPELLLYDDYTKVMNDESGATAMVVELAAKLFGPSATGNPLPVEYAIFIQLSDSLGLTENPNYKLAIEKLYEIGEKRGMIMELIFQLKGDDPAVATDYYNGWLIELENIFADPQLLQMQLSQYGQSFVQYVFNTIDQIDASLGQLLAGEMKAETRKAALDVLLRNNDLSLDLNYDPAWQKEKLAARLVYLKDYFVLEPSSDIQYEIDSITSQLETLETQDSTPTDTGEATSTD
ncbi:MAG TPA: peptidylprolyl isomerase [Mesotoga infera]|nr:peptidylprolyl isomerase [Thermotogaceae bacterium]HOI33668.1 peptidylprolyl isomerase [Mesotoga infera]HPD37277.1 peptidylprolyl isomerase [Mesotoga infera]HRR43271.1 peptidylprolyl isomerase [Mesotoga sp.]HRV00730.1 peptidylprolyl isomerase [Mesotoga sp.]